MRRIISTRGVQWRKVFIEGRVAEGVERIRKDWNQLQPIFLLAGASECFSYKQASNSGYCKDKFTYGMQAHNIIECMICHHLFSIF